MNNIVEINYPNLDNYFKILLLEQECEFAVYKFDLENKLFKTCFYSCLGFLFYIAKGLFTYIAEIGNSYISGVCQSCIILCNIALFLILFLSLPEAIGLICTFVKRIFKKESFTKDNKEWVIKKILTDLSICISDTYFTFDSKGLITGINKDNNILCSYLENKLQNKLNKSMQ
jgi:hypothetical protein